MTHLASSVVAKYRCCALVLVLLIVPLPVIAGISDEQLYTVQQPVDDQSESNRQQAARQALLEVLSRVTGLGTIPRNRPINSALAQPDRFYSEYVFVRSDQASSQDGSAALALEVRFQEQAILALVRTARLCLTRRHSSGRSPKSTQQCQCRATRSCFGQTQSGMRCWGCQRRSWVENTMRLATAVHQ